MIDKFFDNAISILLTLLLGFAGIFIAAVVYDCITGNWKTRVIEVNNPEQRVVCFKTSHDRASTCYPYELLDNERIKKYVEKK